MILEAPAVYELLNTPECADTPSVLIAATYMLSYPTAVSDSMQKEIRHTHTHKKGETKTEKKEEEMKERSTERK